MSDPVLLPALFVLCAKLGIAKAACTESSLLFGTSTHDTDKSHWYTGSNSSPDNRPSESCYNAVAIARYRMYDGKWGTTYACMANPDEDDQVTADDLKAFSRYAERINAVSAKTLEQHEIAMQVKHMAEYLRDNEPPHCHGVCVGSKDSTICADVAVCD